MPTPADNQTQLMDGWPRGINNRSRETEQSIVTENERGVPSSEFLREAINVDLTQFGHPIRRKGYELLSEGYTHSLWSNAQADLGLCVHDGFLSEVLVDGSTQPIKEVHAHAPMSFAEVNNAVYWCNGVESGVLRGPGSTRWGLDLPSHPVLRVGPGAPLDPGQYRVAFACVDEHGEEHGAVESSIFVSEGEGLSAELVGPWVAGAEFVTMFVSQPDGEILYEVPTRPGLGQPVQVQRSWLGRGRECETLNMTPLPPGHIVRYFNGRLYVAWRDAVLFTEPLRYSLYRPAANLYMYPSRVTLLEPTTGGIYVGHSKGVEFLQGDDPFDVRRSTVSRHPPIRNAVTRVPGELMGDAGSDVPVWWGQDGAMVAGLPNGEIRQLTRDRLAVQAYNTGAMLYREQDGMAHVVSSMAKAGQQSGLAATDSAVATVRKHT